MKPLCLDCVCVSLGPPKSFSQRLANRWRADSIHFPSSKDVKSKCIEGERNDLHYNIEKEAARDDTGRQKERLLMAPFNICLMGNDQVTAMRKKKTGEKKGTLLLLNRFHDFYDSFQKSELYNTPAVRCRAIIGSAAAPISFN